MLRYRPYYRYDCGRYIAFDDLFLFNLLAAIFTRRKPDNLYGFALGGNKHYSIIAICDHTYHDYLWEHVLLT